MGRAVCSRSSPSISYSNCFQLSYLFLFFFFQAEDGIRDDLVTGVQTCALPISTILEHSPPHNQVVMDKKESSVPPRLTTHDPKNVPEWSNLMGQDVLKGARVPQIGRASCRERV